jgi:hypothetical protein
MSNKQGGSTVSKRLLCEGWLEEGASASDGSLVFPYSVSYVRQGDQVWFAYGGPADLHESIGEATVLSEYTELDLEERRLPNGQTAKLPKDGKWTVEGIFQLSDTENANKRVYPRKIWEKLIADMKSAPQKSIVERGMIGHLEHPKDGRTDGKEGAMLVTEARLQDDGVVWGTAEVLDTPNGLILQEYLRKGVRWGVSSRGNGSVSDKGMVNEDFELTTWDAVMRPSTPGAYPKVSESPSSHTESEEGETSEVVAEETPQLVLSEVADGELVSRVTELVETEIDSLDSVARHSMLRRLVREQQNVVDAWSANSLKPTEAQELHKWLNKKLYALQEAGTSTLEAAIEEALEYSSDDSASVDDRNYMRLIESLRNQVVDEVSESTTLRERLEIVESDLTTIRGQREALTMRISEQHSEGERELGALRNKLELADELLSEKPCEGRVFEAIQDAIRIQPELNSCRRVLECAKDGETVARLAEVLTSKTTESLVEEVEAGTQEPTRNTLPRGEVASEEVIESNLPSLSEMSPGARLAGRMLAEKTN